MVILDYLLLCFIILGFGIEVSLVYMVHCWWLRYRKQWNETAQCINFSGHGNMTQSCGGEQTCLCTSISWSVREVLVILSLRFVIEAVSVLSVAAFNTSMSAGVSRKWFDALYFCCFTTSPSSSPYWCL